MKKGILLIVLTLSCLIQIKAQYIKVADFRRNYTSLVASMNPEYDNAGEACAVICFFVRDDNFEITPNMGSLRTEQMTGEIRIWVPVGTKKLTVRHQGAMTLSSWEIPVRLEPKVTYEAELDITQKRTGAPISVYGQLGYNILSISGPSVALGLDINHHIVELSAVYGINKTDDWYFYSTDGSAIAAYNYQAFRIGLRYGYDIKASEIFSIAPQVGVAYNGLSGNAVENITNSTYKSASSTSALIAVRLSVGLGKKVRLHLTPEYDFGLSKDDVCKLISDNDNTFKGWTDGFNLNTGIMIYF